MKTNTNKTTPRLNLNNRTTAKELLQSNAISQTNNIPLEYTNKVNQYDIVSTEALDFQSIKTQMKFTFLDNDNNYHELGRVIPNLSLQDQVTQRYIHIKFDDLLIIANLVENDTTFTYLLKSYLQREINASSVNINNIDQTVVISASQINNTLIIEAYYSQIGQELDTNNIKEKQIFVVEYHKFSTYVDVVKNCIYNEAYIQYKLQQNFTNLSLIMKKNIPNLLSSYIYDVNDYITFLVRQLKNKNKHNEKDMINLVFNRANFYSKAIEVNVAFFKMNFVENDYEAFYMSIEEFEYVGSQLANQKIVSMTTKSNTYLTFSVLEDSVFIEALFDKENTQAKLEYRLQSSIEIDKKLFHSIYKAISKTLRFEAQARLAGDKELMNLLTPTTLDYMNNRFLNQPHWNNLF